MIRLLVIFSFIFALFAILPSTGFHLNCYAEQKTAVNMPDRTEILSVFKKAIELNEDFKNTVHTVPLKEHQKKRIELEKFDEEVLDARIEDCVKLLSTARDNELAVEFFKLLISYENSADEGLSYALGKFFLNNPDLVTEAFSKFKKSEQQYLYKTLDWGWHNVTFGKDISQSILRDRTNRLIELAKRSQDNNSSNWKIDWFTLICAIITSSLFATILSLITHTIWRRRERRSLIIAFAYELVFAFHRCVIYYRQNVANEVSYSKLFGFTDAPTLSTFTTAGAKTELVEAIIFLKAIYFQIARHAEEASKYAADADRVAEGQAEKERLRRAAEHGYRTALAFFLAEYNPLLYQAVVKKTEMIIAEVEKKQHKNSNYLSSVFNTAKNVKSELDKLIKTKMPSKQLGEELEKLRQKLDMCLIPRNL